MADTDALRAYRPAVSPTIPGREQIYLSDELRKIEFAIGLIIEQMRTLDARVTAVEPP
jgi:hypothetical protein